MKATVAWLVTDTEHDYPYLVYKEPNKYRYKKIAYLSIKKIVFFEVEDDTQS